MSLGMCHGLTTDRKTVPETAGKMHRDNITQGFDWQPVLKSGYERPTPRHAGDYRDKL